ncbi:formyltransferase family protein [Desulfosporosinus youngiae]|uniref:Methionyl-tRNA formyltransferase n=1 Tax=Desulfosporosinus youngiae DSM 17734 TaxID=768710 RepID=H5XU14_9FIRM|nr:formyltransferase family protein [Desulfosporosinus youngiae]EHQ88972.1 methionyl-tRNA formyltransferase [Desulfosporosinus youngiae DSM 17734]
MRFSEGIVVGKGSLKFKIALLLKNKGLPVTILEHDLRSSAKEPCAFNGIPHHFFHKEALYDRLKQVGHGALIISAINTYLLPADIVSAHTIINYHNALLPRHPGLNAEAWQIYDMDPYAGITWHYVDSHIDTGDIIVQEKFLLDNRITSIKLLKRQNALAYRCFEDFADKLLWCDLPGAKQADHPGRRLHYLKDAPNNRLLELTWTAPKVSAFLRAMDYGPLHLLGIPTVTVKNKNFRCESYQISESGQNRGTALQDNRLYIENNGLKIIVFLSEFSPVQYSADLKSSAVSEK